MNMGTRDRRALAWLGASLAVTALVYLWPTDTGDVVKPMQSSAPTAERRLERLRELAATVPGKQKLVDGVVAQLRAREKGLIDADTPAQAQAQLSQILRKLMRAQSPPMDVGQMEMIPIQAFGKDYGESMVTVSG